MDASEWLRWLRDNPERVYDLSPQQFEVVVAELLASFGWEISLTSRGHDRGIDLLAVSRDANDVETDWAVECKHYRRDRVVSGQIVDQLYGAKERLGVSRALLVTTGRVPRATAEHAAVELVDFDTLSDWFRRYRRSDTDVAHAVTRSFRSCFVSYSHQDEAFATRLVGRLRERGVRVWFAPEDLRPGQKIHEEVGKAIETFDRLILVLSEHSMRSRWVASEVRRARRRELGDGARVLFPISLVPFERVREWEVFDSDSGQDLAAEVREYLIPDFSSWEDASSFDRQLETLLDGLRASP